MNPITRQPASQPTIAPSAAAKPRILIAEDEAIVTRDIGVQLVSMGYAVAGQTAYAEQAVALAQELHPDLVLMDIRLAGTMDGITAAQIIRQRFSLPVVFLTAFSGGETLTRATLAEPFGYVTKPFSERELHTAIEIALYKHQVEIALRRSETKFRTLFDSTGDAVMLLDHKGFFDCNPAALEMFGCTSRETFCSRHPSQLSPQWQPGGMDSKALANQRIATVLATGSQRFEWICQRIDSGETFPAEVLLNAMQLDGQPVLQVVVRNIAQRKQAERDAHASLEAQLRESQKMEAIGTLAGGIAHDFNNIIAIIQLNVELLRKAVGTLPPALDGLERIHLAGVRARDLVQQILSFSRRQPTHRKPIELAPVVLECVHLLRATLPVRITVDMACAPDIPPVLADATQIQQALINLATNAMQAMASGAGRLAITLDTVILDEPMSQSHPALRALYARHQGCTVRLSVSDNGPGMDAATLERIFEPFFTTKPAGEGTGLGLSVVLGIVQGHEAAIVVESRLDQGADFALYLPATTAPAVLSDSAKMRRMASAPVQHRVPQLIYIDDEAELVMLVKRLLEQQGYRVSAHTDAQAALAALRADPAAFDLMLTDYNMPGMSGLDVAREVRTIRADLPVAVVSGYVDETLLSQFEAAGVREVIFKAESVDVICDAVRRLVQARP